MDIEKQLEQSIIKTLAWYDIFDYAPTAEELHKQLWEFPHDLEFASFLNFLGAMQQKGIISSHNGWYYFSDRNELYKQRNDAVHLVEKKLKIAQKAVQKIYWIPYVRGVFLCNTVAFGWPKEDSDVDVFIVVKEGRMWLSRFLITVLLSVFGLRRNKKKAKDKVCLSFYATDTHLDLESIALDEPDTYLIYWLRHIYPLYDPDNLRIDILNKNVWAERYTNRKHDRKLLSRYCAQETGFGMYIKDMFERMWSGSYGNFMNEQAKKIQTQKMERNTNSVQNEKDSRVIISDDMLKFHENDRRELYKSMWQQRYTTILGSV